eukprot:TRINITY_DN9115_c0_g1_i4.p1 TRINITY_DN9115_c0_g1~~TRINITY_DN9115_c0_g1_i4.p1  ORF type:complete len:247 (+),score=14.83 TRINITY_DN9115_c0_g1_i4:162-902(+)
MDDRDIPTPRIGITRPSMRRNPLIVKAPTGHAVRRTPKRIQNMSHGIVTASSSSVATAMQWDEPCSTSARTRSAHTPRLDYIRMNKAALQHGLTTAKDQLELRNSMQLFRRTSETHHAGRRVVSAPPKRDYPAGIPSTQREPLDTLIRGEPGKEWYQQQLSLQTKQRSEKKAQKRHGISMTKAAVLRQKYPEPPPEPLWRMKRFRNTQGALNTFRSTRARDAAMRHHEVDSTDRLGEFGHGLHTTL